MNTVNIKYVTRVHYKYNPPHRKKQHAYVSMNVIRFPRGCEIVYRKKKKKVLGCYTATYFGSHGIWGSCSPATTTEEPTRSPTILTLRHHFSVTEIRRPTGFKDLRGCVTISRLKRCPV